VFNLLVSEHSAEPILMTEGAAIIDRTRFECAAEIEHTKSVPRNPSEMTSDKLFE
jgi:actin-like ATPase involved in cell morphogenesis